MSTSKGLFELQRPVDLVRKLRHDLERMKTSPLDQFAAFDFFTTADCVVDWLHPDRKVFRDNAAARKALRDSSAVLRIASHLANGSKHFHVTAHHSITGTEKSRYVDEGYVEEGYFHEPLVVHLAQEEARELTSATATIEAIALAELLVEFWSRHVPEAEPSAAPNGSPAASVDSSNAPGGPRSVS